MIPPEIAVPNTPARFGPIACIRRNTLLDSLWPTRWDTRAAIGTEAMPAEPMSGLILPWESLHMILAHTTPDAVPNANATRPRKMMRTVL